MIVACACLMFSAVFSLLNSLGMMPGIQTNYNNIKMSQTTFIQMTGTSSTTSQNQDIITSIISGIAGGVSAIANGIIGVGAWLFNFVKGVVYIKSILDQFIQGQEPINTMAYVFQTVLYGVYAVGFYSWWTNRPGP